jgi:hypothetical protein
MEIFLLRGDCIATRISSLPGFLRATWGAFLENTMNTMSTVIFSTGLHSQPALAGLLDAAGVTDQDLRALCTTVVETAKKEAPAILAGIGAGYNGPESYSQREAIHRVDVALLDANKQLLLSALRSAGVENVRVQYEGMGDSGGIEDIDFSPSGVYVKGKNTIVISTNYGWNQDPSVSVSIKKMDLENGLADFAERLVSHFGHGGYENNEGGGGEVIFNVMNDRIDVEHYYNIIEREETNHAL